MILNSQFLNSDDRAAVIGLADSCDSSREDIPGYSRDYYFTSIPDGWAGEMSRVCNYGPNIGEIIWDARRA